MADKDHKVRYFPVNNRDIIVEGMLFTVQEGYSTHIDLDRYVESGVIREATPEEIENLSNPPTSEPEVAESIPNPDAETSDVEGGEDSDTPDSGDEDSDEPQGSDESPVDEGGEGSEDGDVEGADVVVDLNVLDNSVDEILALVSTNLNDEMSGWDARSVQALIDAENAGKTRKSLINGLSEVLESL